MHWGNDAVFLLDRAAGTLSLVSHAAGSAVVTADHTSWLVDLSSDGRYVLIESLASDLLAGATVTSNQRQLYLCDRLGSSCHLQVTHAAGAPGRCRQRRLLLRLRSRAPTNPSYVAYAWAPTWSRARPPRRSGRLPLRPRRAPQRARPPRPDGHFYGQRRLRAPRDRRGGVRRRLRPARSHLVHRRRTPSGRTTTASSTSTRSAWPSTPPRRARSTPARPTASRSPRTAGFLSGQRPLRGLRLSPERGALADQSPSSRRSCTTGGTDERRGLRVHERGRRWVALEPGATETRANVRALAVDPVNPGRHGLRLLGLQVTRTRRSRPTRASAWSIRNWGLGGASPQCVRRWPSILRCRSETRLRRRPWTAHPRRVRVRRHRPAPG